MISTAVVNNFAKMFSSCDFKICIENMIGGIIHLLAYSIAALAYL